MVGVAIGLFILAGATMLLTTQLGDNRRLLLETQLQQDLRVAADMISRDIRRAGYWSDAYKIVWPVAVSDALVNPYSSVSPVLGGEADTVQKFEYQRSTNEENHEHEDSTLTDAEHLGFQLKDDAIQYQIGKGNWQALTDPGVMKVSQFDMKVKSSALPVPCGATCPTPPTGPGGCTLKISVRDIEVTIVANAVHDATVKRSLTDYVRLRNDVPECTK
jgi:type IV pilus assembly protein PilW